MAPSRITPALAVLACFALIAAGPSARAEDRNEGAVWAVNQVAVPLTERFTFHTMVQNRWVNDVETYERTVVRPWLSFDWTENVELEWE